MKQHAGSHVIFRCDSSFAIGSGHVVRCISLAERLGLPAEFICAPHEGSVHAKIKGFRVHLLPRIPRSPDEDQHLCEDIVTAAKPKLLVVDHYGLDTIWERPFYDRTRILVIDDLADRRHFCHALLDNNYSRSKRRYEGLVSQEAQLLLGPKYSLMSKEFIRAAERSIEPGENVLVFFGGTDPSGETLRFIQALEAKKSSLQFKIMVAQGNRHLTALQSLPRSERYEMVFEPNDVPRLMAEARLYFGSGGTVTWERLYMGLPGVVVAMADNQEAFNRDLAADGYLKYLGLKEKVDYGSAITLCETLMGDAKWRAQTAAKGKSLVAPIDPKVILDLLN